MFFLAIRNSNSSRYCSNDKPYKSAFAGQLSIPKDSASTNGWMAHIWFESNIENVDFLVLNAAVVEQNDRNSPALIKLI